jgi:hypothetical protein
MESDSFLRYSVVMPVMAVTPTCRMASYSLGVTDPMSFLATMFFMWAQQLSIGFRSRGFQGQSLALMLLVSKKGLIFFWRNDSFLCIIMECRMPPSTHCTENSKQMTLCGLVSSFGIHVSVSNLYIPMIGAPILLYCVCKQNLSQIHECRNWGRTC